MPKLKINNRKQLVEYINKLGYVYTDELINTPQSAIDSTANRKGFYRLHRDGREILSNETCLQELLCEMGCILK